MPADPPTDEQVREWLGKLAVHSRVTAVSAQGSRHPTWIRKVCAKSVVVFVGHADKQTGIVREQTHWRIEPPTQEESDQLEATEIREKLERCLANRGFSISLAQLRMMLTIIEKEPHAKP